MAACGSLQHIFENPLPENPTLLEHLSSWNQIMPLKPTEPSSFTEIFGELHFKESFVPHSFSSLSSLTESSNSTSAADDLWKEPLSNGEREPSNFHRKSNSFSSTNSESLQLCTEGLGYESLDDVEDLKGVMDEKEWPKEDEEERTLKKQIQYPNLKPGMINRTKSANMEDFPPPISCMGKSGKPWVGFKSYRYGGRFILKEVRVPTHEFLHASRENGRLKLHILVPNEQTREGEDEADDNHENCENTIGKCKVETRP
ncbi:protein FAF-like [Cucumis melo var. makuwa]|nr:protein FAF-like [Cucumis melo var. makuwa]TYK31014.1 protein FAF-like [Cucumis melo var. makuwa]